MAFLFGRECGLDGSGLGWHKTCPKAPTPASEGRFWDASSWPAGCGLRRGGRPKAHLPNVQASGEAVQEQPSPPPLLDVLASPGLGDIRSWNVVHDAGLPPSGLDLVCHCWGQSYGEVQFFQSNTLLL